MSLSGVWLDFRFSHEKAEGNNSNFDTHMFVAYMSLPPCGCYVP